MITANTSFRRNRKVEEQEVKRKQRQQAKLEKINKAYATRMVVSDVSQLNVGVLSTLSAQLGGPSPLGKKKNELVEQVRKREARQLQTTSNNRLLQNMMMEEEKHDDDEATTLEAFIAKLPQAQEPHDSTNSLTTQENDTGCV